MRPNSLVVVFVGALALLASEAEAEDCRERPMGPYEIESFATSESCAGCHPVHYDQWQGSPHAYAVVDPLFWAGNQASYEVNEVENFCITCHAPPADVTNPEPDPAQHAMGTADLPEAAQGGVGCVSCHKIYDVSEGHKQLTVCDDHYFGPISDPAAPHGASYEAAFSQAGFCRPCHDVNISTKDMSGLVQIEFTNTEWSAANEAAGGTDTAPAIATCQECHMPATAGQAAADGPARTVHGHGFAGPDVALVPFPDAHRQYRAAQALVRSAAAVSVEQDGTALRVEVTNRIVGHDLPTGSAHMRAVWVHIRVAGADGEVYLESGDVDANGDLRDATSAIDPYGDPWISSGESVFRQYMYDAQGHEVLAAYGEVVTVDRQMLGSGETVTIDYELDGAVPMDAVYPLDVEVELLFRPAANAILRALDVPDETIARVPTFVIDSAETLVAEPL